MLIKFIIVYNLLLNKIPNVVSKKSLYFLFFILFFWQRLFLHSRFNSTYACGLKKPLQRWEYVLGFHNAKNLNFLYAKLRAD